MLLLILSALLYARWAASLTISAPSTAIAGQGIVATWAADSSDQGDLNFCYGTWGSPASEYVYQFTLDVTVPTTGLNPITPPGPGEYYFGITSAAFGGTMLAMSDKIIVLAATSSAVTTTQPTTAASSPTTTKAIQQTSTNPTTTTALLSTTATRILTSSSATTGIQSQIFNTESSSSAPLSSIVSLSTSASSNLTPTSLGANTIDSTKTTSKTPVIVGCIVAAIVLILLVLGCMILRRRRRQGALGLPSQSEMPTPFDVNRYSPRFSAGASEVAPSFDVNRYYAPSGSSEAAFAGNRYYAPIPTGASPIAHTFLPNRQYPPLPSGASQMIPSFDANRQYPPIPSGASQMAPSFDANRHYPPIPSGASDIAPSSTSSEPLDRNSWARGLYESTSEHESSVANSGTTTSARREKEMSAEVSRLRNEVALLREHIPRVLETPPSYAHVLRQNDGLTL